MVEIRNLTKRYGTHLAVDDLSFTVEPGRIYGFLGPNGAGKSTTMNIMTGCLAPSAGTVTICGCDILEQPRQAKKHIGYLPEIPPLYTDMTPEEYLAFCAGLKGIRGKKNVKEQVDRAIARTGLEQYRRRLIRQLSKGYRQRVGLAQAILGDPELVILDEPTVGLDPAQIIEIRQLIRELGREHTVILSSHILTEVSEVCDTILIISGGRLVGTGSPEELARQMQRRPVLEITVAGADEAAARTALESVEGVSVTGITAGEGSLTCTLELTGEGDLRPALSMALAGAGLPVLGMTEHRMSLEDVFLELTGGETTQEKEEADHAEHL